MKKLTDFNEEIISLEDIEKVLRNKGDFKKIALIDGNLPVKKDNNYVFGSEESSGITPFGLRRIRGYLDNFGIESEIFELKDIIGLDAKEIHKLFKSFEIIGLSSLSPSVDFVFMFASKLKKIFPEKFIIGGAEHLALDWEYTLEHKDKTGFDACCTMQGELPLLCLSLGIELSKIGSIAYLENKNNKVRIIRNINFPRLSESCIYLIGQPHKAKLPYKVSETIVNPEIIKFFKMGGSTQTGSGCNYCCTFCTNAKFYGKFESSLKTAKLEVKELHDKNVDFMFVRNAMLNVSQEHFDNFIEFMKNINSTRKKLAWYSFISVNDVHIDFKEMAKAGCLMIGVGLEEILGERESLGKGKKLEFATDFINKAKKSLLVRTLIILGLPSHHSIKKEQIKNRFLDYMKKNPQAIYRINFWTPTPGTLDFTRFSSALEKNPREDKEGFRKFDNMHPLVSPKKLRKLLKLKELTGKEYVQKKEEWVTLRDEIMKEYLISTEHNRFLETLKDKIFLGRKNLLYDIALEFKKVSLEL